VEFELQVMGPDRAVDLCTPFDYHELWFFNADRGAAFSPTIEAQLPPGLEYLPGTTQVQIGGSTTWVAADDPIGTNDLIYWNVGAWLPGGLLGSVDDAPDHQLRLRFLTQPACGFVSGDRITFRGFGENACGDIANRIERPGPALEVHTGLNLPRTMLSWLGADTVQVCEESLLLSWQIDFEQPSGALDSFWVYLPIGTRVDTTGSRWSDGTPVDWSIDARGSRLRLTAPIPPGSRSVSLSVLARLPDALDCGSVQIEAQTLQSTLATCGNDPEPCAVYHLTGRIGVFIFVKKAQFANASGTWHIDPDGRWRVEFEVEKSPGTPASGLSWQIFTDTPPTGILDSGDRKVYEFEVPINAWDGNHLRWSETIPDSLGDEACDWWLVLEAADNCLCEDLRVPLKNRPVTLPSDTLCPGEFWRIGLDSLEGYTYQWTGVETDCEKCAEIDVLVLERQDSLSARLEVISPRGCRQLYFFSLMSHPGPAVSFSDTLACVGQKLAFQVPTGYRWNWTGPGIINPEDAVHVLEADSSVKYRIEMESPEGCVFVDTLNLRVIPEPEVHLDSLYLFCPGDSLTISGIVKGAIREYTWFPGESFEDENAFPGRFVSGVRSGSVELLVIDSAGCSARDTTMVNISVLNLEAEEEEVALCIGDSVLLTVTGADTYQWVPSGGLSCDTCGVTYWSPGSDTSVLVYSMDSLGCTDSIEIHASLIPGFLDSMTVLICPGDSINLGDTLVTESGRYVRTYDADLHCDSTVVYHIMNYVLDTPVIVGDTLVLLGDTVHWRTVGGEGGQFRWEGPFDYLSCDTCREITFTLADSGDVVLHWISEAGCAFESRRRISYYELVCPEVDNVFVPNAFSPNGDGVNDVLMVRGTGDAGMLFMVYNRWGQEVFKSVNPDYGWDGHFEGAQLRPDTYSYYLELRCPGGELIRRKGNVMIMK
jgi:gliding motility-associated-like protein